MNPTPTDPFERLTILERAQFLYDSAQRRHAEALDRHQAQLDRHEAMLERHQSSMARLGQLLDQQQRMQQDLIGISARLQTTMDAIKDLLNRPNGH
jgi:hypothetical protein